MLQGGRLRTSRPMIHTEVVVREAILTCVTPDNSRLPLLDAFSPWLKREFVRAARKDCLEPSSPKQWPLWGGGRGLSFF